MKNGLSARQLAVASFTGLLSPAAAVAGLDWRGALLAVPVVLAAAWCWGGLGDGGRGWLEWWRGAGGKLLSLPYIVWALLFASAVLASAGARITAPDGNGAGWVCLLVWLPVLWMARGKPSAFGRAAEMFYLAMGAALVLVLLFGGMQVRSQWLLAQTGALWPSFLTAAGVGCSGVAAVLLWDGGKEGEPQRWLPWSGATALAAALLAAVTVGVLSPALAAAQARPFFVMTVGLGKTARVEGLVSAIWLLADVTLLGLLLQCARRLWSALGLPWTRGAPWVLALIVLGGALALQRTDLAGVLLRTVVPACGLVLGGLIPALACLWEKWRTRGKD